MNWNHATGRILSLLAAITVVGAGAARADTIAEGGCLRIVDKNQVPVGLCPLEHTDVKVDISGFVARVTLNQHFKNPSSETIEAVYTFPMSDRAAVDRMTMKVGDRTVAGVIKKKEEARQAYEAARAAGQAASLLDQERPNIFTQSVANIVAGSKVEIEISYVEYLEYEDGSYTFSFPMVVGPRYIPGTPASATGTNQVPDAGRISPPVTPEGTRAGHDISLAINLDAGVAIHDVRSDLHEIDVDRPDDTKAVVRLREKATIPNRDFILHYAVAGETIQDAVMTHADDRGGFFTLIMQPPKRVKPAAITPKEMIFVIDCSGSMRGFPIEKAKATMKGCIEGMNPNDTFNLVSFAGGTGYCFQEPVANTAENRKKALDYLAGLEGGGGTEMMSAINAALGNQSDTKRLRVVCFMTDAFIGNDMAILDAIQKNVKNARVFAFGVGNSVNRFLIEGMGRMGRGASEVVTLNSNADAAVERFRDRIQSPLLTDISIDFGGLPIEDVYPDPGATPDLFAARPLILKGRYTGSGDGQITVRGSTAEGPFERTVKVALPKESGDHDVLAPLWARERITWLMDQDWIGAQNGKPDGDIKQAVTDLGLRYNLVTQYTSFVAVEERKITEGGTTKTVQVPVEMPDGVSYEGVFGTDKRRADESKGVMLGGAMPAPASAGVAFVEQRSRAQLTESPRTNESLSVASPAPAAPMPVAKPDRARPSVASKEVAPTDAKVKDAPSQSASKLDPALQGLAAKLMNGNYTQGRVKVVNGEVQVFIRMSDDSQARLDELKKAGIQIVSHASSNKTILARVKVADLEKVAALTYVIRIEPPSM